MIIRLIHPADRDEWLRMRMALWPHHTPEELVSEMGEILNDMTKQPVFVAERPGGGLCGFIEASIHVGSYGCETQLVGYIEGWYVDPDLRREGIGSHLIHTVEQWSKEQGYLEIASDCKIDNEMSWRAHLALGFEETERLIHFRKCLNPLKKQSRESSQ